MRYPYVTFQVSSFLGSVLTLFTLRQSTPGLATAQVVFHQMTLGCAEVALRTLMLRVSFVSLELVFFQTAFKTALVVAKIAFVHFL